MTGVHSVTYIKNGQPVHCEDYEAIDFMANGQLAFDIYNFLCDAEIGDEVVIKVECPE